MKKIRLFPICPLLITILLCLSIFGLTPLYAQIPSSRAAEYLYKVGEDYYNQGDYRQALHEFRKVLLIDRGHGGARGYINRILAAERQRKKKFKELAIAEALREGMEILRVGEEIRSEEKEKREIACLSLERDQEEAGQGLKERAEKKVFLFSPSPLEAEAGMLQIIEQEIKPAEISLASESGQEKIAEKLKEEEKTLPGKEKKRIKLAKVSLPAVKKPEEKKKTREIKAEDIRRLELSEDLWVAQPKTTLKIELGKSLIIEGRTIARYLVEKPEKLEINRVDSDSVLINAKNIGSTFLHIWEGKGRWTFNIKVVSPYIFPSQEKILLAEEEAFRIDYTANWQSYYRKNEGDKFRKRVLSFNQGVGINGPTPYGNFDASLRASKYAEKYKITNYSVGLTRGRFGRFKNFSIRGFDFYKSFSALSYPGKTLKGVLWDSDAFNQNIHYTLFRGEEGESYGYLRPGVLEKRKSYIEGLRLSLFPYQDKNYSFNFARGYGSGRQSYLRDKVYSLEGEWKFNDKSFSGEIAYDQNSLAGLLHSQFRFPRFDFGISFRNIEEDFTTITGSPGNRGEIGSIIKTAWQAKENLDISSNLDVYRTRYNSNARAGKKLNFDWDSALSLRLGEFSSLVTSLFYINEPGLSFPRRYLNLRSTYSYSFELLEKKISPFFGVGFARSRNPLSVSSDYDTYKFSGGLRIPLTENISYRLNYEYNRLEEKYSGEKGSPMLLGSDIDYRLDILPSLKVNMRASFRKESNSGLTHSFLSGEDSAEGSLRLNFTPSKDTEFFAEGRLRKAWVESAGGMDYMEADFMLGLRSSWDTFFRWSSRGEISGIVFKDLNGNGEREDGEPFLKSIKVKVGRKDLTTDKNGYFSTVVRGRKVLVQLDQETLPENYILTTPSPLEVDISPVGSRLKFGASSFSTVYGVVFYDTNSNGKFDPQQDTILPNVRLYLGEKPTFTNLEGSYYFKHLKEGKYVLKLDINSLPLEFIPSVPLRKEVDLSEGVNYRYSFSLRKK